MLSSVMLSEIIGKTRPTLVNWAKRDEFKPYVVMVGKKVMFKESVLDFLKTYAPANRYYKQRKGTNKARTGDSICWGCKTNINECMWMQFNIPIKGWVAERVTNSNHSRKVGYRVQYCPNFKER